jgi:hypothetical protein
LALSLGLPKAANRASRSIQQFLNHVLRHEAHHAAGLDEPRAQERDLAYYSWEDHRSIARIDQCVQVLSVMVNQTTGIEVDPAYLAKFRVLLPALSTFALDQRLGGTVDVDGALTMMTVQHFAEVTGGDG